MADFLLFYNDYSKWYFYVTVLFFSCITALCTYKLNILLKNYNVIHNKRARLFLEIFLNLYIFNLFSSLLQHYIKNIFESCSKDKCIKYSLKIQYKIVDRILQHRNFDVPFFCWTFVNILDSQAARNGCVIHASALVA